MPELLLQGTEALRDTFKLDAAEVWLHSGGVLTLVATDPGRELAALVLPPAEESIAATAPISGRAWAGVWLPFLLEDRPDSALRIAPISASGTLLGLIVIQRRLRGDSLAGEADVTLKELAREVGVGLNKQRLDAALQASLEELHRQAQDLRASRARIVAAADAERRRVERDLHDGAQQGLVAIAVKARLIERLEQADPARSRALLGELVADVQAALEELRTLAHGIYPLLLSDGGLLEALSVACRRASIPAELSAADLRRYPPEIEAAVYFCCLEALQNAAKHAGDGASATVRIWEEAGGLRFEVRDDGAGFDAVHDGAGAGVTNMSDRLGAVGGSLCVESEPGGGTRVVGAAPLPPGPGAE
jgi:signal transduction histidine kinase